MGLAEGKDDEEEAVVVETVSPPSMGLMGDGAEEGEVAAIDEDVDEADWPTLKDLFRPSDPFLPPLPPPRLFSPLAASESEVTAPELETDGVAAVSAAGVVVAVFVAAFTERDATTSERDSFFFIPPPPLAIDSPLHRLSAKCLRRQTIHRYKQISSSLISPAWQQHSRW